MPDIAEELEAELFAVENGARSPREVPGINRVPDNPVADVLREVGGARLSRESDTNLPKLKLKKLKLKPKKLQLKTVPKVEQDPKARRPKRKKKRKRKATDAANKPKVERRSLEGDGLTELERQIIKLVDEGGTVAVRNLADSIFGMEAVREAGKKTIDNPLVRRIRNGLRKPIEYGVLQRKSKGTVSVTTGFKKSGMKVAERSVQYIKEAREQIREANKQRELAKAISEAAKAKGAT